MIIERKIRNGSHGRTKNTLKVKANEVKEHLGASQERKGLIPQGGKQELEGLLDRGCKEDCSAQRVIFNTIAQNTCEISGDSNLRTDFGSSTRGVHPFSGGPFGPPNGAEKGLSRRGENLGPPN